MRAANFDRVARIYQGLEVATFGPLLQRARLVHLGHLASANDILLLGDGDGRALQQLVGLAPFASITSVDASRAMLRLARQRVPAAESHRVVFVHGDARAMTFAAAAYDAIVSQWFFDCFTGEETAALVRTLAPAIRPGGLWLFTDFAIPERGLPRVASRAITQSLYSFFRVTTGISARRLPATEREIMGQGFVRKASAEFAGGMLRSVVFSKPARQTP